MIPTLPTCRSWLKIREHIELVEDGRIYIELVNASKGRVARAKQSRAGIQRSVDKGWLRRTEIRDIRLEVHPGRR